MYLNEWSARSIHRAGRVIARTMPGSDPHQATSLHPTAQHWVHCASYCTTPTASCSVTCRFLDQIPLLLLLSFWLIMHTLGNCVWSNVVVYRIYIFFIFDFHKLKWDTTMRWERILRHYFFSKCLYFWCKRNIMNSYKYFYGETLLAK